MTIDVDKIIIASTVLASIFLLYLAGVLGKTAVLIAKVSGCLTLLLCSGLAIYFVYDCFFKKEIFRKDEK